MTDALELIVTVDHIHTFRNTWRKIEHQIFLKGDDGKLYFTTTTSRRIFDKFSTLNGRKVKITCLVCGHSSDWNADRVKDILIKDIVFDK